MFLTGGEHQRVEGAFDVIAGIAAALLSCKCDGSRGLLLEALDVVAQLGDSPGEEEQLLRLCTAGIRSSGHEQSAAALAVCVDTGRVVWRMRTFLWVHLARWCRGGCRRQGWVTCFVWTQGQQTQQWLWGRVSGRWARNWRVWQKKLALRLYLVPQNL